MLKLLGIVVFTLGLSLSVIIMPANAADYKDQANKTVDDYLSHSKQRKLLENQMEILRLKTEIAKAFNECISAGAAPEDCDVAGTVSTSAAIQQADVASVNSGLDSSDSLSEPASIRLLRELSAEIKGVKSSMNDSAAPTPENPEDIPKFIKVIGKKAYFSTSSGIIGAGIDTTLPGGYIVKNFNLTTSFLEKNGMEYIVAMDWKKEDKSKSGNRRLKYAKPIR